MVVVEDLLGVGEIIIDLRLLIHANHTQSPELRTIAFEFCGLCGHTPAVSAGTVLERRFHWPQWSLSL